MIKKINEKEETLLKIIGNIHDGDCSEYTETASKEYLKAIAIGIKYLVKHSK